jgi:hypothetical protein
MSRLRAGRPEAAAVIWHWRERPGSGSREQSPSKARIMGSVQGLVGASVATAIYLLWSQTIGMVVFCISAIILFTALVSPNGLYRAIQGLFAALGNFTGRVLTWLTLVPLFYLFFLPFGLLMRRGRRDRMKRFLEPDEESYWEPHKAFSAADHERQF